MQRRTVAATILLTLIAGMLSWWLLRRQLSPLVNASKMVNEMSGPGKSLHPLPVANRDEIGQLVRGFNELLEIIRQREAQLSTERDFFGALLKQSSDGVLLFSPDDYCIREANPSLCKMLGYQHDELCAMHVGDLVDAPMQSISDNVRRTMQGIPFVVGERNYRRKDSSRITLEVNAAVVETDRGPLIMANLRDVSERKRAEEALMRESRRHTLFLRNASDGVHILDADGNVLEVSDSFCEMLGYSHEQLVGANVSLWDVQWSPQELKQLIAQQLATQERSIFETQHRRRDGTLVDVEVTGRGLELNGKWVLFNSARDITERKQAEEKLYLAASVFTHAREGILITTPDGIIIDVNDTFSRITGYSREEILGCNPRILGSGRQSKEFYAAMWRDLTANGHWSGEIWNRHKNGEVYAEMLTISAVRDAKGNTRQYVALFSDITASKEHEKQLEHIAHYDTLTGLPNRVLLADRLHQAMAQAHRRAQPLAVAYLDLDGFKVINDHHGHGAGDQLLMTMAASMKLALREGDTLARLGGDEFVAVLLDLPDVQASVPMLARLLSAASAPVRVGDLMLKVSASLGVTFYPQAEDVDADQLLRQADQAMYQAKLAGKNRYHIFDAEQDRSVRGHHESLERIRHALIEQEFVLHYQPEVNMRTGAVIGAEALIRWQHPERGLLLPEVFLPVIEDHPLAIDIGDWVIDTALTEMALWQASGLDIPVSVNVGARQLQQADFAERLGEILAAHPNVRPGDLELEVLETSALEDVIRVSEIMQACREIGVMFALDDFGTGYSSLIYLKRLPVNRLKIDQSFVRDMLEDPDDLAILEGVIGLAGAFHRQIIAEGVETVEHGEMLLQLGCELAQGYGVARPMPACELIGWSATWRPNPAWINRRPISRDSLPLLFARVEHRAWTVAIEAFLTGERAVRPRLDHQCHFDKWLDVESMSRDGAQPAFQTINLLHRQVHALAAELCELQAQGRNSEVLARLGELRGLRDTLHEQMKALLQESRQ
jgi:diguanylate cyclase (GGDEF)-like protein/PAS domain S-box-containing protein